MDAARVRSYALALMSIRNVDGCRAIFTRSRSASIALAPATSCALGASNCMGEKIRLLHSSQRGDDTNVESLARFNSLTTRCMTDDELINAAWLSITASSALKPGG